MSSLLEEGRMPCPNSSRKQPAANWEAEVGQIDELVMVDFWAVWCGPCQMVAPIVEELAKEYEGKLKVMKLNTDEVPEIAGKFQIMSIPTDSLFQERTTGLKK